jgi:hypothetical protein
MKRLTIITTILTLGGFGASALAQDIAPGVIANKIVTGSYEDTSNEYVAPPVSVFNFEFGGDDPLQPFFTVDPGFHSNPPIAGVVPFIPNATLKFNILSDLTYWNGSGAEAFGPVPAGTSLALDLGSTRHVDIGTGETPPKAGFLIGTSDAQGNLHEHLESTISNSSGDPLPGFYRFEMQLYTDAPGIAQADPIFITYALTPEPASVLLLGMGLAFLTRRNRKSRTTAS